MVSGAETSVVLEPKTQGALYISQDHIHLEGPVSSTVAGLSMRKRKAIGMGI